MYDNLDKTLFEPVPIFIDGLRRFILLEWSYIYKGTIRDFFPPAAFLPESPNGFQIYSESIAGLSEELQRKMLHAVGRPVDIEELAGLIDFAFLALHGEFGEDGQVQGLLESLNIPYTGSGLRPCSIGMDKAFQKKLMKSAGFESPEVLIIKKEDWSEDRTEAFFQKSVHRIGFPMVIRPANQGSSIGVSIINEDLGIEGFRESIDKAFFQKKISGESWKALDKDQKVAHIQHWTDIREGLGFPMELVHSKEKETIYHPEKLLIRLEALFEKKVENVLLQSWLTEQLVVVESFIRGKEFSCIVIRQEDGGAVALPPTEIVKGGEVFDYRSKYLPGMSRKETPIKLPEEDIQAIRKECERLFHFFEFNTYARIDGFITEDKKIILNDPNTTSGMLPSSFFFHQAAEIGLNPSQFLTYIVRISIQERLWNALSRKPYDVLLEKLDQALKQEHKTASTRKKIAVILGGYSFERHISVESGRNIFEKLSSSDKYEPIPVFLHGTASEYSLYQIPINLLLKDNADDIKDKITNFSVHPVINDIREKCIEITQKYASSDVVFEPQALTFEELAKKADGVFVGLHGRPGEDGTIQKELERVGLPYNGSGPLSSGVTINKYETLRRLAREGFTVAQQKLVKKEAFLADPDLLLSELRESFSFPLIAKPVDDGCSSAVKMIKNSDQLRAYFKTIFREKEEIEESLLAILQMNEKEEFPIKQEALIESLITKGEAERFMEVTVGLMTRYEKDVLKYEVLEPSEALALGEVLSLEEKFLAGEGQNITPARFGKTEEAYQMVAEQVKADIGRAAQILGVKGYARIDAFVRIYADGKVETIIIEVNSLPGMTPATCIFHQAAIKGFKPYQFIDQILEFAFYERSLTQSVEEN